MSDDAAALQAYAGRRCEDSFQLLVERHLPLVYSVALRRAAGEHALAEEIAQTVFLDLARKAPSLPRGVVLAGWLHRHTCFTASKAVRTEARRRLRENAAAAAAEPAFGTDEPWQRIESVLDDLLPRLAPLDRQAILLRFFEGRDFRGIAREFGVSEAAAQKRVQRALEKLRRLLAGRQIGVSTASLAALLSAHTAFAAVPAHLCSGIVAGAAAGAAISTATATLPGIIAMTTMTKIKTGALAALIVGLTVPLTLQHRSLQDLRRDNSRLFQQASQVETLRAENQQLQRLARDSDVSTSEFAELLRLRGEIGLLRQKTNELAALAREVERLRGARVNPAVQSGPEESPLDVAAARDLIFAPTSSTEQKLEGLRILRTADARTDDVVRQMVQVYYQTTNEEARADIFRQLHGVATPELKQPLLEAISDPGMAPQVREEAAETLDAFIADEKVYAWLEHVAANDPDPKIRHHATRSLESAERGAR